MEGFFTAAQLESLGPRNGSGDLLPKCGACGLYRGCNSPKIAPQGRGSSGILLVGEFPGETDDLRGRLFAGESGELLRETVGRAGEDLSDLRVTNSIICHPPGNRLPGKGKEVAWCRPNLVKTIREFKPRVVVTLGRHPLESILQGHWEDDIGTLDRWVGSKIPLNDYWLCPTWAPSFVLKERKEMMERLFREHLTEAFEIQDPPEALPDFSSRIEKLYEEKAIVSALRYFDEAGGLIAFDYETNSLKPEYPDSLIRSCAVSNGKRTIAYPWHGRAIAATSVLLASSRTRKIAANMKFEDRWTLFHLGHPVSGWDWDTMLATHARDNRTAICSLKFQAFVQLGVPTYNNKIEPYLYSVAGSHYNRIKEVDLGVLLQYNGMDALLEWFLARKQQKSFGGSLHSWRTVYGSE